MVTCLFWRCDACFYTLICHLPPLFAEYSSNILLNSSNLEFFTQRGMCICASLISSISIVISYTVRWACWLFFYYQNILNHPNFIVAVFCLLLHSSPPFPFPIFFLHLYRLVRASVLFALFSKYRRDVLVYWRACDQACSFVLNALQA